MRLADLVVVVRRRIDALPGLASREGEIDDSLWIRVDSYAFAQALGAIAERLRNEHGVAEVAFRARSRGGFAELDLTWSGAAIASDALDSWEMHPLQIGAEGSPLTIRQVVERHGGEVWHQSNAPERLSWFRFLIPLAQPVAARRRAPVSADARPEYYDFDLFRSLGADREMLERPLAGLNYTVFDTETTGLEPSAGERIVSIGAVRIVNGRLRKRDVYAQLVDPERRLKYDRSIGIVRRTPGLRPEDI